MTQKRKAIIFDVDDVLLDYTLGIREFVRKRTGRDIVGRNTKYDLREWLQVQSNKEMYAIINDFNFHSIEFGELPPVDNFTVHAVRRLRQEFTDCAFIIVTKSGNKGWGTAARTLNIRNCFGTDVFDDIIIIEPNESKRQTYINIAMEYDVRMVIDDHIQNINEALKLGLPCITFGRTHNESYHDNPKYEFVHNWIDMYTKLKRTLQGE